LGIGFGGGEPTLYRDFSLLCEFVTKHTALAVTFTTHAHRIDARLASALQKNVNFIRVSMDGIGRTYEMLRGRSFHQFQKKLELVRAVAPFGINFVVNATTIADVDEAVALSIEFGASEFLLLPEQATSAREGIDNVTRQKLVAWVSTFGAPIRLAVSEADANGLPTCNPLPKERGLRSYAHIDASGILKRSSFDTEGVAIGEAGISVALEKLRELSGRTQ
jgi:hypothetical protein